MALNANALTTVLEVRQMLNIPYSNDTYTIPTPADPVDTLLDTRFETLINGVSTYIEQYTRAFFVQKSITEYLDFDGSRYVQLSHYPVSDVTISIDNTRAFGADTALQATDMILDTDTGEITLLDSVAVPAKQAQAVIKAVYKAGYVSVPSSVKQACLSLVGALYHQIDKGQFNQKKITVSTGATVEFYDQFDPLTRNTLDSYKRITL